MNKHDNDDFFNVELEKKQKELDAARRGAVNNQPDDFSRWSNYYSDDKGSYPTVRTRPSGAKPRTRVTAFLLALGLILMFAFGFIIASLINNVEVPPTVEETIKEPILNEVMDSLRNTFYEGITDEQWIQMLANAGTAMYQTVDPYGQLLSPQTAYDLLYPDVTSGPSLSYGFSYYQIAGFGMQIATVIPDSYSYGRVEVGDIVISIDNLRGYGGSNVIYNGVTYTEIDFSALDSATMQGVLALSYTADFHIIRDNAIVNLSLQRGEYGSKNNLLPSGDKKYYYVDYYFDNSNTNLSTTNENGALINAYTERHLGEMSADIGYISLKEFSGHGDTWGRTTTATELKEVLTKFKSLGKKNLILDLKGNPGGDVDITADVAGMLAVVVNQSEADQFNLVNNLGELKVATLDSVDQLNNRTFSVASSYSKYFTMPTDRKYIVVWTDGGSASASELLTGVLLDYGTAVHMGTTTYGKGIAQSVLPLEDYPGQVVMNNGRIGTFYWTLYYTTSRYYSPKGNNIHGIGFTPTAQYNNLSNYAQLMSKTVSYFG
jgi:C-terminal processing protease CtpA/Prc